MKDYSIEDLVELVEDGARYLAEIETKNGSFMDIFNSVLDDVDVDEGTEVAIKTIV